MAVDHSAPRPPEDAYRQKFIKCCFFYKFKTFPRLKIFALPMPDFIRAYVQARPEIGFRVTDSALRKALTARQRNHFGLRQKMDIEKLKDLARRKGTAIVGTAMTNNEDTRQQIAKNFELEWSSLKAADKQEVMGPNTGDKEFDKAIARLCEIRMIGNGRMTWRKIPTLVRAAR
jgi:hypothetical protein